jgi:hypothetical protein
MVHSDLMGNDTKRARRDKNAQLPFDLIYKIFRAKSTPAADLPTRLFWTRPMETARANHAKELRRPGRI